MKPVDCIPEEALGEALSLPAGDPRRAHLDSCPRCRALVLSYRAFLAPERDPAASYGAPEERALDAARERLLGASPAADPTAPARRAEAPAGGSPWWEALFGPKLRPAWGLAALVVVAAVVVLMPRGHDAELGTQVRGLAGSPLALAEPVYEPGGVRLSWRGAAGAERYEVRIFSAALDPVARIDAGADTNLSLAAEQLPETFGRGELLLYRVAAIHGGDELAISETRPLQKR